MLLVIVRQLSGRQGPELKLMLLVNAAVGKARAKSANSVTRLIPLLDLPQGLKTVAGQSANGEGLFCLRVAVLSFIRFFGFQSFGAGELPNRGLLLILKPNSLAAVVVVACLAGLQRIAFSRPVKQEFL
jgi:hypothetical protein